jgi:hypothetical protein
MLPIHPQSPKELPHDARERDLLLDESLLPQSIPFEKGLYDLNDANSADLYQLVGSPPATPSIPVVPVPSPIPTPTTSATFLPTRSTALTTVGASRKYPSNNVSSPNVYRHGQVALTPHGTLPQNVVQDLTLSMSNVADIPHTVTSVLSLDQVDPSVTDNIDPHIATAKAQEAEATPTTDGTVINPVISVPQGENYVDITEFMNLPQAEAAKKLGIPSSTLSKRWKEAVQKRKWPWRAVCKIDKEIMTLLHNVPQGHTGPLPEEMEGRLGRLLRKRQEELKPVVVRLS